MPLNSAMHKITEKLDRHHLTNQCGQAIIEYVLLVSLIAITLISSLLSTGDVIYKILTSIPFVSS